MKKTIFKITVDHAIDLITNSSSELFVLEGKTAEIVEDMIKDAYPNYLDEYNAPVSMRDLSTDNLDTYISYDRRTYNFKAETDCSLYGIPAEKLWKNWNTRLGKEWWYPQLTDEGAALVKAKLDPENKMYFMFSKDENPDWDMQEKLMCIGERYHLG